MNVYKILLKLGYDIVAVDNSVFTVIPIKSKLKAMPYWSKTHTPYSQIKLITKEVGFNNCGNLYVCFAEVDSPDEIFDMYEYRNEDVEYA